MDFYKLIRIGKRSVLDFWSCIEDSYLIEKIYEETENVLITLRDKDQIFRFIYFKNRKNGKGIRLLKEDTTYWGILWIKRKDIGGAVETLEDKARFHTCLRLFKKALRDGTISIEIEESPYPPSQHVPLTDREKDVLALIERGKTIETICNNLGITLSKIPSIVKNLRLKGHSLPEEIANLEFTIPFAREREDLSQELQDS
ncbi:MAG: hypothetical protein AB2392_18000 [Neobacillus sp.]